MKTSNKAAADTYEDVKNLIFSVCNEFHRRHGGDIDEMISLANVVFCNVYAMEFDETKGSFANLLATSIRRRLIDNMVISGRHRRRTSSLDVQDENGQTLAGQVPDRSHRSFNLADFAAQVSEDAMMVMSLVVEAPAEILSVVVGKGEQPQNWRSTIRQYLRKQLGWCADRINEAYGEVGAVLG